MLLRVFRTLIPALMVMFTSALFAQNNQIHKNMYKNNWDKADSLLAQGLPKSAAAIVEDILKDAGTRDNKPEIIKARLFLMGTSAKTEEDTDINNIQKAESFLQAATGAEKALWQSITTELYWNYYQNNRWHIHDRTPLLQTESSDIVTWDAPAFFRKIATLYKASIEQKNSLVQVPVEQYAPIILEGKNTRKLRPTLYDLLVFRAIVFFENDEKDLIRPAGRFQIEDSTWFDDARNFSRLAIKAEDTGSLQLKALQLFQQVIATHLNDAEPDALIDADLQRLSFVYNRSVHPDKKNLYKNALDRLLKRYANHPGAAQITYTRIALDVEEPVQTFYRQRPSTPTSKDRNLPEAVARLKEIISRFPETEGAVNAHNLLQALQEQKLELETEEVNIPGENIKALIRYKNTGNIYLYIYRIKNEATFSTYIPEADLLKQIQTLQPYKSWSQHLPGYEDMEQHSTEINIGTLPHGAYFLVAATREQLKDNGNIITATRFQASNLSFVIDNENNIHVLHRKTGQPVANTQIQFWAGQYNNNTRKDELKSIERAMTDASGKVAMPAASKNNYENRIRALSFTNNKDTLQISGYFQDNSYKNKIPNQTRTFFFTDRAIYRPGQAIHFKGIMLQSNEGGRDNQVLPGRKTTVTLYDVNRQKVASLDVITNEYGSFNGTFTAPEGLLGGRMSISNQSGSLSIAVEEYKRPKFYVDFDTLKSNYALNQNVKVKSFAKAYAGNVIDGATVKYRVVRQARFPYFWCYYRYGMPRSPQMEITNGTTVTNEDGSFEIEFITIPDPEVNPESLPVFTYTLYADVTDINGETRSGQTSIQCGYRSLQIIAALPEEGTSKDLQNINITTQNLNGIFTPATVNIHIAPLQFPGMFRRRLWEIPDQFALSESEFRQAFPNDEYKEESNYLNWQKGKTIYSQTITTQSDGSVSIPHNIWKQKGWHVIEISTKDAQGNDITEKKYTYLWEPGMKGEEQKDFIVYTTRGSYEPGEELKLWLSTAVKNPYLLKSSSKKTDNRYPISFTLTEQDRGGIAFYWLYVNDNRVYSAHKTIAIPWSNKNLQMEWATHRDKLIPGQEEEWTLTIKGNKKEKVAAEIVAGMYDASLDAFLPHRWDWNMLFPSVYSQRPWSSNNGFGIAYHRLLKNDITYHYQQYEKQYDELYLSQVLTQYAYPTLRYRNVAAAPAAKDGVSITSRSGNAKERLENSATPQQSDAMEEIAEVTLNSEQEKAPEKINDIPLRTNLRETAFFFPTLATDADGNVKIKFNIPEALTEWKMMAFAHTKDWQTAYIEGKVKTQKELMVQPNLPRFLRQKDNMVLSTKISNLSDSVLNGMATIEILDANTLQPVNLSFQITKEQQNFSVSKGQSTTVDWNIRIPESRYTPVIIRIIAKAGNFSDGEENILPVITNRTLVTETMPLPIRGNKPKTFQLEKLLHNQSPTLSQHALTVEFTGNPAWYAVQALPFLIEYPYECAEQTFNRFYANALAAHIVKQSPQIEKIFEQWKTKDTAALLSNLEKNEELKSALLEETPWVLDAKNEKEQKQRIAALMETHKLARNLQNSLRKLEQMQMADGSFPWFKGMNGDRFITQYIITGIGRLQYLGVAGADKALTNTLVNKSLTYLDYKLKEDYDLLLKNKASLEQQHISYNQIQYLYMRSFYNDKVVPAEVQPAFEYYKKQATRYWQQFNPFMQGQIALALKRFKDANTPNKIILSLKETAIQNEEMGMYWKTMRPGYYWHEAPIEAQSLLIETFLEVANDKPSADAMKVWLLKQKQTQNWKTTKATADACYALLLGGSNWLTREPVVTIQLGNEVISSSRIDTEAGTGYFKKRYSGSEVKNEMGNVQVSVQEKNNNAITDNVSWGAVYWQYFEDLDKITGAATPINIQKQLFVERNSKNGPVLVALDGKENLKIGDKIKIRIELRVDRDMEYVHLKDMRAACLEPVNVLSSYKYQGGLGYYESTKDIATNFFFNFLRKGTYVFEYPVFVTAKGNFSNGIATVQCMYAPEFSSHSEGIRITVE